jgi:hypothetical protein
MHAWALCTGQQPLPSSLQWRNFQCLNWWKEGAQRHNSSTVSGKVREYWGTRDKTGGRWPGSPPGHMLSPAVPFMAPQLRGINGDRRGIHAPKSWVHSPHSADQKNFSFKERGTTSGDQDVSLAKPPSSFLQPAVFFFWPTPLPAYLSYPAIPLCPVYPIPTLTHALLASMTYRGCRNTHPGHIPLS